MLTVGSLFSGIGGLELGLERAGMHVKWQVENDEYCRRVLAKHWPNVQRFEDIRELTGDELEPVDLICGGWPCQPFSIAGKRLGVADERNMWPEFIRIVRAVRPKWVLGENVPGVLSAHDGRYFGEILRDLAESGFDAEWDCIQAAAVGAPHIRDRVFIVAESSGIGRGAGRQGRPDSSGAWESEQSLQDVAYTDSEPMERAAITRPECHHWSIEPDVGRVAHGVPRRVDRLRALGNAVVPQVAEWIGRRIVAADRIDGGR